jgi:hypothetical protein
LDIKSILRSEKLGLDQENSSDLDLDINTACRIWKDDTGSFFSAASQGSTYEDFGDHIQAPFCQRAQQIRGSKHEVCYSHEPRLGQEEDTLGSVRLIGGSRGL